MTAFGLAALVVASGCATFAPDQIAPAALATTWAFRFVDPRQFVFPPGSTCASREKSETFVSQLAPA